jgi:hypothetical protein
MPRPNRLYTIDGKYYYIKDGKKVFVKVPAGVSQKQVSKINIKNIIKLAESKRVVRKKKRRNLSYQKKIAPVLQKSETSGLPIYFFKPKKEIPTLEEQAKVSDDTNVEKLAKLLLKESKLVPSSSKLPAEPTIAQGKPSIAGMLTEKAGLPKPGETKPAAIASVANTRRGAPPGPRAEIGSKELAKILYSQISKGNVPSLNEAETLIPSKFILTREKYDKAMKIAEDQVEKTSRGEQETGFFKRAMKAMTPAALRRRPPATPDTVSNLERKFAAVDGGVGESKEGNGYGYGYDGLYDDEIETIAKKRLKDYIPCIAKDETNELLKYVKKGDKQFGFVINTDNSDQPGRHWRCVYINNMDDYPSIEYFDPLCEGKPEQSLIDICRKIAIKMNPSKLFKYKQNMIRRQSKLTSNCGYHCIHFLEGRYQGIPFSEITGYDQYVENMKKEHGELDGSGAGEKQLEPFMKKYDSYI